jgi:hypothetical protein
VDAAAMRALGAVDVEEALDFAKDPVERPGLEARDGGDRVAVHRVARPDDRAPGALHRSDKARQVLEHLVRAEPADQRQAARFVLRVEDVDQAEQARPAPATGRT